MINLSGVENNEDLLSRVMTTIHGPLLAGDVLVKALGYSSGGALRQASLRNMAPVTLFSVPQRKFKYALSAEVAEWLLQQRLAKSDRQLEIDFHMVESRFALLKLSVLDYGYLLDELELIKLLKLDGGDLIAQKKKLDAQPFALFRIDHRHTKRVALTIEAFHYFV